jgi:hypothetical protein
LELAGGSKKLSKKPVFQVISGYFRIILRGGGSLKRKEEVRMQGRDCRKFEASKNGVSRLERKR